MCQLLGMNANVPTDICFSFSGFRQRGGLTDHHADGWGIGFFEDAGCRLFIDTEASVTSPIAALVLFAKATVSVTSLVSLMLFIQSLMVLAILVPSITGIIASAFGT